MEAKKYRVMCWQPANFGFQDPFFVDIAPENGVIHNMMFYSRLKLYRGNDPTKNIRNIANSIYLAAIDDQEPDISFPQATPDMQKRLLPIILDTFNKMRAEGKETTLTTILSAWETEKMAEEFLPASAKKDADAFERRERQKRSMFAAKHLPLHPQTPQEEQILQQKEEFISSARHHQTALERRAFQDAELNPIERMKAKMRQYDGD
ncbi:MAG: hypothetical protein IJ738_03235 [Alphaproteobacteria bacterium]|nr:hypothetical protein [Alphaproteobacteria bacterium]